MAMSFVAGDLTVEQFKELMLGKTELVFSDQIKRSVILSHATVQTILDKGEVVYGVNTGFGKLANQIIGKEDLAALQRNLVLSHATGVGPYLPVKTARLIYVMKLNSLCRGYSGVSEELIAFMINYFNHGIVPAIPEKGSVGASGDLVPLAHLALGLIGEGKVFYKGQLLSANEALTACQLKPMELGPKEGLALLNGMQVSNAVVFDALLKCENLFKHAIVSGALSVDGACGSASPFNLTLHRVRGHQAQCDVAELYLNLLDGSAIIHSHKDCGRVQDPYSLRCQPQVMGACLIQIQQAFKSVITEANGVSDNPIVIPETNEIISGGNFHGEVVAMAADNLALAISEIGALSERRIALLIDQTISGLPAFLVKDGGINSGFMIAHVTAAACASDNKALAHPHSVDSLPTSANQEDHVSMAMNGARRLIPMLDNTLSILAIEILSACQALEFRKPLKTSEKLNQVYGNVRQVVEPYGQDRYLGEDIEKIKHMILTGELIKPVENELGSLLDN